MKKIINNKDNIVDDMLSGYIKANSDRVKFSSVSKRIILRKQPKNTNKTFIPDIILVPLVAYEQKLNRLGYGAGYYDRVLKKISLHKKIIAIGIGFSFQ